MTVVNGGDMAHISMETALRKVVSKQLTTCTVVEKGQVIRLGLLEQIGQTVFVDLPFDQAASILMTLPRLLSIALKAQTDDAGARYVFQVGHWSVEWEKGLECLILTLQTQDGFEVAFAIPLDACAEIGSALKRHSEAAAGDDSSRKPPALN